VEMLDVARTPSFLKGLAETRAGLAAKVATRQKLVDHANAKLLRAQAELAGCDHLIRKHYSYVDPENIRPIHGWQGHHGQRGALKTAMLEYLHSRAPAEVSGPELCRVLIDAFALQFHTKKARDRWWSNSGPTQLLRLQREGCIERLTTPGQNFAPSKWRWEAQAALTLDELTVQASRAAGVATSQATAIPDDAVVIEDEDDLPS